MKTLFPVTFWTVGFLSASVTGVVAQENWPQFRGETAGVIADNPSLPDSWGPHALRLHHARGLRGDRNR